VICTPYPIFYVDKIEKNEMSEACGTYGGEMYTRFWLGNLRERDHLENTGVYGKITLKWIFSKWNGGGGGVDRIDLT
jgi:hypothetical protein